MKQAIGYVRVSTSEQEVEAQKAAINEAAARQGVKVSRFVEEVISSRKAERKIYEVVHGLKEGETLIVYELSRLARSIGEVFEIVQEIKRRKANLWILKPEVRTGIGGNDLQADMLMFALSTAAQIERDLISERTKNSLRALKAQGVKLGRPEGKGRKVEEAAAKKKVVPEALIESYKNRILTAAAIARLLDLDQRTVRAWLKLKDVKRG